ncbi:MAG: peroxiredoxin [Bacillota bacterium]
MKTASKIFSSLIILFISACGGNAQNLKEGQPAPNFTLQDAYGKSYTLSSYKGKTPVVIYFYPKASTPGCTKEACSFRDNISKFNEQDIPVFGVSVDSKEKIKEFIDQYKLNFPLLSDESKNVSREYGVLNKLGVSSRITFIIDKEGKINTILRDVDVNKHSEDVYPIVAKLK